MRSLLEGGRTAVVVAAVAVALNAAVLLSGCAAPAGSPGAAEPGSSTDVGPSSDSFLCMGERIPRSVIDDPVRIADLDEAGQAAIANATYDDGSPLDLDHPESWSVAERNETRIVLIRHRFAIGAGVTDAARGAAGEATGETGVDDAGTVPYDPTAEQDTERISLTTELWPGWAVGAEGSCTLTVDLGELQVPHVWMDQDALPTRDSRELNLMVLDPSCGGDADMPDRIEVVSLEEDDTEVRVLLGVRPLPDGAYDCAGFPPTPYTITLTTPLGERDVADASRPVKTWIFDSSLLDDE
ncbi:hypothetical protein ACFPZL_11560 [Leucobacter soli]|uniref:Uncharacterized protein n=1 Tax=Leucobacter soli TaxID=2812850 RepID=A0A916JS77_9MICO|nr:hypothetical protein [Leucobacter soli]CAG7598628.1 hypothetical protein LEUCIP111803_00241 [Leucobacter soli]